VPTLKRYIETHCRDNGFRGLFEDSCELCRVTVGLVARMHERGLTPGELAARAGVPVRDVTDLRDAERCSFDTAAALCICLGVPPPDGCRRAP
jgi:hypothetical protein